MGKAAKEDTPRGSDGARGLRATQNGGLAADRVPNYGRDLPLIGQVRYCHPDDGEERPRPTRTRHPGWRTCANLLPPILFTYYMYSRYSTIEPLYF